MKPAANEEAAWERQERYRGKPHAWLQWKGTAVCMDVHCKCGFHSHLDAEFTYYVRCPKCQRVYFCNGHIQLIEMIEGFENPCIKEDERAREELSLEKIADEIVGNLPGRNRKP
jgi:hypothetical protein